MFTNEADVLANYSQLYFFNADVRELKINRRKLNICPFPESERLIKDVSYCTVRAILGPFEFTFVDKSAKINQ